VAEEELSRRSKGELFGLASATMLRCQHSEVTDVAPNLSRHQEESVKRIR
jgi:hypothetical protein